MTVTLRTSRCSFCLAGYADKVGMQSHADVTLAWYVARNDDELTISGRVSVVFVPLL